MMQTGELNNIIKELLEIKFNIEKAGITDHKVQNLSTYINKATIKAAHQRMNGNKACGTDKMTKEEYGMNLADNIEDLVERMKSGKYRPNPAKRVYIPKLGSDKERPLGISCYEDKLVERVIADILTMIYEPKFCNESFGFRPERNCHEAVKQAIEVIQHRRSSCVVEADIKGFFDNLEHQWLIKFLEHDIADRKFIELIKKFLKAGIMENGKLLNREKGSPQGNAMSPVLANVYLHYVLDLWFKVKVKQWCKGQCYLIRYCDDFICCFQYKKEAEVFYKSLQKRFAKFGLEISLDKTKILEFGRFAEQDRKKRGEGKPETFDFLGFTFYCGTDRWKRFYRCKVKTSKKKFRSKIKEMKEWIKENRTMELNLMFKKINAKLQGHYQYYGVTDNSKEINNYYALTKKLLFKWLNRRSQRKSYTCSGFREGLLRTFPLTQPTIKVNLLENREQNMA